MNDRQETFRLPQIIVFRIRIQVKLNRKSVNFETSKQNQEVLPIHVSYKTWDRMYLQTLEALTLFYVGHVVRDQCWKRGLLKPSVQDRDHDIFSDSRYRW